MTGHRAYIGIGANLGDRLRNVEVAVARLADLGSIVRRSSYYRTQPWGKSDQPWYLNAVALVETSLSPPQLLGRLQAIEEDLGRERSERWGPRAIDLDILLYDDAKFASAELSIPHPRLHERAFVLVPLSEIDDRYAPLRDKLSASELAGVVRVERESVASMSQEEALSAIEHVRVLAKFLAEGEVRRVRIVRGDEEIEVFTRPFIDAKSRDEIERWNGEWLSHEPEGHSREAFLALRAEIAPDRSDVTTWPDLLDIDEQREVPRRTSNVT